jgi:hypothetical protein
MNAITKALRTFGLFWWNFLVGDTPEIFVATLVIIGGALALKHDRSAGLVYIVVLTALTLSATVYRGRKRLS